MNDEPVLLRPAPLILAFWIVLFALILVNGYALNLLRLSADPGIIFIVILFEAILMIRWLVRFPLNITGDPVELAGFLGVVVLTGLYFVLPSLPTLLPPSYSGDAANHLAFVNSVYQSNQIISDYPGGPALIGATAAHWLGWLPLRVLHPLGALWAGLTAGGIYGIACAALPDRRVNKTVALFAVFALFVPWSYFAGALIGSEYFWSQVTAQLFLIAFVWFLIEYRRARYPFWAIGMALSLIGISVSFQLWLAIPIAMLGLAILWDWRVQVPARQMLNMLLIALGPSAAFWIAVLIAGSRFVPNPSRLSSSGAIPMPSFNALGGVFLVLPILGFLILMRTGEHGRTIAAFTALAALQSVALFAGNIFFGVSVYWVVKTLYLLVLPLAVCAAVPLAKLTEFAERWKNREVFTSPVTFAVCLLILGAGIFRVFPPPSFSPLSESDVDVALWAKENLKTREINLIGRKSIAAQWLGVGLWGERFPDDMLVDLAALGPKTFEEWRDDSAWGEYLFVASSQRLPLDGALRTIYRRGDSMIVSKPPVPRAADSSAPAARFGAALDLIDYDLPTRTLRAGDTISLTARIQTQNVPAHQVVWRVQLRDRNYNAAAESRVDPFDNKFPLDRWPAGTILSQPFKLPLPTDLRAGLYNLQLGLYYVGSGSPLIYQSTEGVADDVMSLGQIKVELPAATTHELGAAARVDLNVGDSFRLLGYRLPAKSRLHPGETLKVYLYWQSLAKTPKDFTAFVHLLDATGTLRAQSDAAPRNGTYPTSIWDAGEIILDPRELTLPRDAPPGNYRLEVGMYEWPSLQRLSITDSDNRAQGDHVILPETVSVTGN